MSSNDAAIRIVNLNKCYEIYTAPRDRLKQFVLPPLQRLSGQPAKQYFREFWAVKDISFDVKKGETVGIIGRNGSGKSTLLQMICGTLSPTSGSVTTSGRVAALLELGSGFNPDFTGRENVYLNATVLGLSLAEINARFDAIAAFADIGQFIDQPVKTYSSGMMVRLAFAVAINVDPEILIVDEALSVGDELFQRKCFSRIEAIRAAGATILFVSHSGGTIVELCDRAVLLDAGEKLAIGHPKQIVGRYQKLLYAPADMKDAIREQILRAETPTSAPAASAPALESVISEHTASLHESFDSHLQPTSTIEYASQGAHIESPAVLTLAGSQVNNLVLKPNVDYHFRVEIDTNRLRMWIDGQLVTDHTELFPIGSGTIGLYTYDPGKSFDDVRIWQRDVPELISPLAIGDEAYRAGRFAGKTSSGCDGGLRSHSGRGSDAA